MKEEDRRGFSLVEVLISLILVCLVIEIIFTSFIYVKRQYVRETYKQEAVLYGREMLQYVREKRSLEGGVTEEDLRDYLKDRPKGMSDYTYSFIWIPFAYKSHTVQPVEVGSAIKCSTEPSFNWNSVEEVISSKRLYLNTTKQRGEGVHHDKAGYWLIGIVGRKQGESHYEGLQYLVTYQ